MDKDNCSYRKTVASKLGLHGSDKGRSHSGTAPKFAEGGNVEKKAGGGPNPFGLFRKLMQPRHHGRHREKPEMSAAVMPEEKAPAMKIGGAFKGLGRAIRHDMSKASHKVAGAAKHFARKEKAGFEEIGRKTNKNVIKPSREGFNKHISSPIKTGAKIVGRVATKMGNDANKHIVKPTGKYLKDAAKMKVGGQFPTMPQRPRYTTKPFPAGNVPGMKFGGGLGRAIGRGLSKKGHNAFSKDNKHNVEMRHDVHKSFGSAKKTGGAIQKLAAGGVGKIRHGITPKTGVAHAKFQDKNQYM